MPDSLDLCCHVRTRRMRSATSRLLAVALLAAAGLTSGCAALQDPAVPTASARPAVPTSSHHQITSYEQCMLDAGWISVEHPDGTLIFGAPEKQLSAFQQSNDECATDSGIDINPSPPPLTEEDIREGYRSLLAMRECLISKGFDYKEKPPSLQAFLDSGATWTPFNDIARGDFFAAEEACPQGTFYKNGSQ